MRKKVVLISLITLVMLSVPSLAQDPKDIADKAGNVIHFDAMEMTSTLKIIDKNGKTRSRKVQNVTKKFGNIIKTKIRFLSPADVSGTTILIWDQEKSDDAMWIYMPAMRNTRRIVSSEKGKSFMGSEFSNADMAKPNINDYQYKLLGTETINGKTCWKVESTFIKAAHEKDYGYKKRVAYIDKELSLTYRTEYYGFDSKLFKIMTISDYRKQSNGKYFAFSMTAQNLRNGRKSVIEVDEFKMATAYGEQYFEVESIEK